MMHILKKILEKVRRRRKFVNNIIHHDPESAPQAKIFLDLTAGILTFRRDSTFLAGTSNASV